MCPHAYLLSAQFNTLHGTEYKITCGACLCVFLHVYTGFGGKYLERLDGWMDGLGLTAYISKTVKDRGSVRMGHQQEMTKGESIAYVADDVTHDFLPIIIHYWLSNAPHWTAVEEPKPAGRTEICLID